MVLVGVGVVILLLFDATVVGVAAGVVGTNIPLMKAFRLGFP